MKPLIIRLPMVRETKTYLVYDEDGMQGVIAKIYLDKDLDPPTGKIKITIEDDEDGDD